MAYEPNNANGQATMANSQPVVLASDQSALTISSHAVTNAGTFVVQENGAALTALQLIDNAVSGAGFNITQMNGVNLSMGSGINGTGVQRVTIATDDEINDDLDAIRVATELIDNAVSGSGFNISQINGVTPLMGSGATGTGSVRVTAATDSPEVTALQIMDDWDNGASDGASVSGDVAHDTADAGEPVKVGFKAYELDGTEPGTAVAEGDRVNGIADKYGRQYVAAQHPRFWHVSADYASAQTNTSIKAAPGASIALYVTKITISNGATAGNITLLDGSGGTVLHEIYPAINGGVAEYFPECPIKLTDNTALCITSTTVTTHSVNIGGFID